MTTMKTERDQCLISHGHDEGTLSITIPVKNLISPKLFQSEKKRIGDAHWYLEIDLANQWTSKIKCDSETEDYSYDVTYAAQFHFIRETLAIENLKDTFICENHKSARLVHDSTYTLAMYEKRFSELDPAELIYETSILKVVIDLSITKKYIHFSTQFASDRHFSWSDCVLVVNDKRVHVNKKYLAIHSEVFDKMFFSNFCEKDKDEIELGDLDHHEFIQLLGVIYPCMQQITDANVEGVLKLADRFQMIPLVERCAHWLKSSSEISMSKILLLSQQYRLSELQQYSLEYYKESALRVKKLKQEVEYMQLSQEVKLLILENAVESMVEASLKLDNMSETFTNRSLDSSVFDLD